MNNPHNSAPRFALFPWPPGCAGYRLLRLYEDLVGPGGTATYSRRRRYLEGLDRRNLLPTQQWQAKAARAAGGSLREALAGSGRTVVVLGQATWAALALPPSAPLVLPVLVDDTAWRRLPHPSGRNLWYNEPANRLVVGLLLEEMIDGSRG